MYCIVIPVHTVNPSLTLLLRSLETYLDSTLHTLFLISPEPIDVSTTLPLRTLVDRYFTLPNTSGWFKQQLIKLAIASYIPTDVYLVLDSDMVLSVPLTYSDLFHNAALKYNSESFPTSNSKHFSQNTRWWEASAGFLNVDVPRTDQHLMAATPQVLSTRIVRELLSFLPENWKDEFVRRECTEFTLYWLFLQQRHLTSFYTILGYPLWSHTFTHNVLDLEDATPRVMTNALTTPCSFFSVIQGYLPFDRAPLLSLGYQLLGRRKVDAVFLCASTLIPKRRQFFSAQERLKQTLHTAQQLKHHVPNALSILIDGTEAHLLTEDIRTQLNAAYDVVLFPSDVRQWVDHPTNIAHGECALLERGVDYLIQSILPDVAPRHLFKMGTRYHLTNEFQLSNYSQTQFTFRQHIDESIQKPVFTTGFFGISIPQLHFFHSLLQRIHPEIDRIGMIERVYRELIPSDHVQLIPTLGLEGRLSYQGAIFKK